MPSNVSQSVQLSRSSGGNWRHSRENGVIHKWQFITPSAVVRQLLVHGTADGACLGGQRHVNFCACKHDLRITDE